MKYRIEVEVDFQGTPDVQLVRSLMCGVLGRSDAFFCHGAIVAVKEVTAVSTNLNDFIPS